MEKRNENRAAQMPTGAGLVGALDLVMGLLERVVGKPKPTWKKPKKKTKSPLVRALESWRLKSMLSFGEDEQGAIEDADAAGDSEAGKKGGRLDGSRNFKTRLRLETVAKHRAAGSKKCKAIQDAAAELAPSVKGVKAEKIAIRRALEKHGWPRS
jgi:hypothetical protein